VPGGDGAGVEDLEHDVRAARDDHLACLVELEAAVIDGHLAAVLGAHRAAELGRNYIEKPSLRYQVSMGAYVCDERALAFLPDGVCQFPDLVLRLLEAGERVAALHSDADWYDIGTVGEYERASADVERYPEKYDLEPRPHTEHDLIPAIEAEQQDQAAERPAAAPSQRC
jgi:NDP-sugar pyrophosphorylase family protein